LKDTDEMMGRMKPVVREIRVQMHEESVEDGARGLMGYPFNVWQV
jgi:hypothetical protein